MEETETKTKSPLEKAAPIVFGVIVLFGIYYGFTKLLPNFNLGGYVSSGGIQQVNQTVTKVDVEFLNSEAFNNLKLIQDSPVFNKVQAGETILKGKSDPFAPSY
jgi:hypothetical protein